MKIRSIIGYKLDGHTPVPMYMENLHEWGQWFETFDRHVRLTEFDNGDRVSTVFLGIDHSFHGGTPILFETMIFGGPHDGYQERYETWDDAVLGHINALLMYFEREELNKFYVEKN
jgi:hypothetical protein